MSLMVSFWQDLWSVPLPQVLNGLDPDPAAQAFSCWSHKETDETGHLIGRGYPLKAVS